MHLISAFLVAVAFALVLIPVSPQAQAQLDGPRIILHSSFVDSQGNTNVVGTVRNYADVPVRVAVGLSTVDGRTLEADTYGRTIRPLTDSPFKFILGEGMQQVAAPFLLEVKELNEVQYDMLTLTYDGMAVGEERMFVGKVKNTGPFDIHNVSVFAAVHSPDHTAQLDTVRSNVIPVLRAGEESDFAAVPDRAIQPSVLYYSCAGLDYDDPITTIKVGEGKILAYDLTAAAQVRNFRYENATDSLDFGIRPYSPYGDAVTLKIAQLSSNQTITVVVDGNIHDAKVKADGRTMNIEFFIPEGDHEVRIQGVRNVPELSHAIVVLVGIMAAGIASTRFFKAAFKMS